MPGVNALYAMVIPNIDQVESIEGYPVCSPETGQAICRLIMDCDSRRNRELPYDKQFMPGGVWLNSGFSTRDDLGLALWEVVPVPPEKIKYKEKC